MTGITTYAYLYLHGENRLQYYGRLRDEAALQRFVNDNLEGALLYSDYRPPEHALLTNVNVLGSTSEGVVLCPVTEGLIRRHGMADRRLSGEDESGFFSLDGTPLNEADAGSKATSATTIPAAIVVYEDQPSEMQLTLAFQETFQHYPEAPGCLLGLGITNMDDFYERWPEVPDSIANSIALNHYAEVVNQASQSAKQVLHGNKKMHLKQVAICCLRVASAFPPWINSWECCSPYLDVRTSNVLNAHAAGGPHALAKFDDHQLTHLPNLGAKSLRTLFSALTGLLNNRIVLVREESHSSIAVTAAPQKRNIMLTEADRTAPDNHFSSEDALPPGEILGDPKLSSTLQGLTERAFIALPLACETLSIKPHDYLDAIIARLKGATLEDCGKQYNVTREAIRQNEGKVAKWLTKNYPLILDRLKTLCSDGSVDAQTKELYRDLLAFASLHIGMARLLSEKVDGTMRDWLNLLTITPPAGTIENSKVLFNMLSVSPDVGKTFPGYFGIFSHGFNRTSAPRESIALPLPNTLEAIDIQDLIHETLLPALVGLDQDVARVTGLELLARHGVPESVAHLLVECALIHWVMPDDKGKNHLPYATSEAHRERQETLNLIRGAKRPLHVVEDIFNVIRPEEISHHRAYATVCNWIASLQDQMHSSDPDYPVLIGNSYIATINQLGLDSENIDECAAYMESVMAQSLGREFSIRELASTLNEAGIPSFNWPDAWPDHPRISTHNFAHVILVNQRHPNTRNMGRFVWKHGPWTDEPDTESRTQVTDIYKDLFSRHRRPLRARELIDAAKAVRGRGVAFEQILELNGIVRLEGSGKDTLYWDTDLGPWPPEPEPELEISATAREACKALFRARRRPILGKDLFAAVQEADNNQAQYIDISKIARIDGLVRLQGKEHKTLFWDIDLDPWDDEMQPDVAVLQQRVIRWLQMHQVPVTVDRLTSLFQEFHDLLLPLTEMEKAVLLARHPDMIMQIGPNKRLMVDLTNEREVTS